MPHAIKLACSTEEYHAIDAVSQSRLKIFLRDPRLYYELFVEKSRPQPETTPAQQLGKDVERLVLYGQMPSAESGESGEVVIIPPDRLNASGHRKGSAWTDYAKQMASEKPGCRLLTQKEFDETFGKLIAIQNAVYGHTRARRLLDGAERHIAIMWQDQQTGLPCKAQLDAAKLVGTRWVVPDLKTCRNSSPEPFNKSIWEYGYHLQAAQYRTAWIELTQEDPIFAFIACETSPSYAVETHDLHRDWFVLAEQILRPAMASLAKAYESNTWQRPTWGKVNTLAPLPWMKQSNEITLLQWME